MNIANIHEAKDRLFQVLQTTKLSQTAVMNLQPGGLSSEEMNVHKKSDQVVLVVTGELLAEVADEKKTLGPGDICIVPAGTPHRFVNTGKETSLSFNVYTPPEYPADQTYDD